MAKKYKTLTNEHAKGYIPHKSPEMSTRAETVDTNHHKRAREPRHSKESASASEMSTVAETFDRNQEK